MFSAAVLFLMLNKPICNQQNQGQMWPDAANTDKQALLMLARAGTLEICVSSRVGYQWEHPTVNIHRR